MANKLTRKELVQEDVIRKTLTETSSWAIDNLKFIGAAVAGVVLVALAVWGWQLWSAHRTEVTQSALAEALAIYQGEVRAADAGPDTRADFEKPKHSFATEQERSEKALAAFQAVADEHSGTVPGNLAAYYVALIRHETGDTEAARQGMQTVIDEAQSPEIRNLARNALSQFLLSAGQVEEARTLLNRILEEPSPNFPIQLVLMTLAKADEENGNLDAALERYRRVSAEFVGTPAASEADERIRRIEQMTESPESEQ